MNAPTKPTRAMRMLDTLYNLVTGLGGARDKSQSTQFGVVEINSAVAEAMYRGDWVARKIVKAPADDSTREWRAWQADNDQIELIEEVERKFHVQFRVNQGLIKARLYGGAALILGVDDGKAPDQELDVENVKKDGLKFVHAVSKHELGIEDGLETDLMSPYFGEPKMYVRQIKGVATPQIRIHPSRVIRIQGEEYPDPNMSSDGWGESVLQAVHDAVRNAGLVTQSSAQLIEELKVDVIKIPDLTQQLGDQETTNLLTQRLSYGMLSKSTVNALVLDKDDEWERVSAQLAGIPDIIKMYLLIAAGAADIPATRLLGQSPVGLNSTGESDTRNYYDRIASDQVNTLSPTLDRLDEVIIRSALGTRDPNIYYEWNPLWQMTEAETAEIAAKKAATFKLDVDMMIIPTDALREVRINQLVEAGTYPGLEIAIEESDGEVINPKLEAQLALVEKQAELAPEPAPAKLGEKVVPFKKKAPAVKDYDPNQPRAPAGSEAGGEWTKGAGSARAFEAKGTMQSMLKAMKGKSPTQVNKLVKEWAGGNWTTPLSKKDFEKVDDYISIGERLNRVLRGYTKPVAEDKQEIKNINSVFAKSRLNKDSILWRGVGGSKVNAASFKKAVGKVVELNGYTSTSKDPSVANDFGGTVMEIFAPKGSKAIDVSYQTGGYEREVILPHKSRFRVESVDGKRVRLRLVS